MIKFSKKFSKKFFSVHIPIREIKIGKFNETNKQSNKKRKKMIKKSWIPGPEKEEKLSWEIKK